MVTKRNWAAIMQYAHDNQLGHHFEPAMQTLKDILPLLGQQSQSRVMINRIGIVLLQEKVLVVAPSCPDYSHSHGKYDFTAVGGGVPLLSQLHIQFLKAIKIPNAEYQIVVADQEEEDVALCKKVGLTYDQFTHRIDQSIQATKEHLLDKNWKVSRMTERFPGLRTLETSCIHELSNDQSLTSRINNDTLARSAMYHQIGISSFSEMRQRTIKAAAQYCALAKIAAHEGLLVCNHETVNLGWYNRYGAAVLHNPTSIY